MSLITTLQNETVDSTVSLSTVLRRAKVLSSILGEQSFASWVDSELSGYRGKVAVPDYRCMRIMSLGTFSGYFGRMVRNVPIPILHLPKNLQPLVSEVKFHQGVRELEQLARSSAKGLRIAWPADLVVLARDHLEMADGSALIEAWHPVESAIIEGILDTVRNRLLDFLLRLRELQPGAVGSDEALSTISQEVVTNVFHITVEGSGNVIAAGQQVSQHAALSVGPGDLRSLLAYVREMLVPEAAVKDLEVAIQEDGAEPGAELGPRVRQWLGNASVTVAKGGWKLVSEAAPTLLSKAVCRYFGLE